MVAALAGDGGARVHGFMGIGEMWLMYVIILLCPELLSGTARLWLQWLPLSRTALRPTLLPPAALALLAVALVGGVIGPTLVPGFNALEWGGRRTKTPATTTSTGARWCRQDRELARADRVAVVAAYALLHWQLGRSDFAGVSRRG